MLIDLKRAPRIEFGPHLIRAKDGTVAGCGGPGICKWCIRAEKRVSE